MLRAVIAIAIIVGGAAIARADRAAADRAAAEADALAKAKNFAAAAAKLREAYAQDPRPDFICNIGVAYHKAQELPRAQLYLNRCLERGTALGDAPYLEQVRGTLAAIEAALRAGDYTPVDIVVEPRFATVAIDAFESDETFDGGRTVWLRFGSHRVTVRAEGFVEQSVPAVAKDRAVLPLRITLERAPVTTPAKPPPPAPSRPSKILPIATTAVALALGAFAVYANLTAREHADQAAFALRDSAYEDEVSSMDTWNTIFAVDVALAGAAAVASGYLWYRVLRAPGTVRFEPAPGGAALTVGGTF